METERKCRRRWICNGARVRNRDKEQERRDEWATEGEGE